MNKTPGEASLPEFVPEASGFAIEQLRAGDVILTTHPNDRISKAIRAVTGSQFSHAILCIDPPWCVEASDNGVVKFRLDRFCVRYQGYARVLRLRPGIATNDQLRSAASWAGEQASREYADWDVLWTLVDGVDPKEPHKFFCSQLVATAYKDIPTGLPEPARTSPESIARCASFEDITTQVLRRANESDCFNFSGYLDDVANNQLQAVEAATKHRILHKISPYFKRHNLPAPTSYFELQASLLSVFVNGDPVASPELDNAVATAIDESSFAKIAGTFFPYAAPMFYIDRYIKHALPTLTRQQLETFHKSYTKVREERTRSIADRLMWFAIWTRGSQEFSSKTFGRLSSIEGDMLARDVMYAEAISRSLQIVEDALAEVL